jgi:transcriptional regulator with XRE-family HTH domain
MTSKLLSYRILLDARERAGLSQRALAERAGTAQSVVARIELGATSPTTETLRRLIDAAGFELGMSLRPKLVFDPQELDDVPRILGLTPEQRLREVANIDRLVAAARRG